MPRTARLSAGQVCYHVLNRGNRAAEVFHTQWDYQAFVEMIGRACRQVPMGVLGYCLMPDHFHLVLRPVEDGGLGRWMHWLMTAYVRRYHQQYETQGHLWQGRYRAFPVQPNHHLIKILRFVERNPLRSGLVKRAEDWLWSSLRWRESCRPPEFLAEPPVTPPPHWHQLVNQHQAYTEIAAIKGCLLRGTPFGEPAWVVRTARRLGIESSLRPRGRPPKSGQSEYSGF